jgi:hypothetical protein
VIGMKSQLVPLIKKFSEMNRKVVVENISDSVGVKGNYIKNGNGNKKHVISFEKKVNLKKLPTYVDVIDLEKNDKTWYLIFKIKLAN